MKLKLHWQNTMNNVKFRQFPKDLSKTNDEN